MERFLTTTFGSKIRDGYAEVRDILDPTQDQARQKEERKMNGEICYNCGHVESKHLHGEGGWRVCPDGSGVFMSVFPENGTKCVVCGDVYADHAAGKCPSRLGSNFCMAVPDPTATIKENDPINHPAHYTFGKIEVADAIDDWELSIWRGTALKYIVRAGRKHKETELEDLKKAAWYLAREIRNMERKQAK